MATTRGRVEKKFPGSTAQGSLSFRAKTKQKNLPLQGTKTIHKAVTTRTVAATIVLAVVILPRAAWTHENAVAVQHMVQEEACPGSSHLELAQMPVNQIPDTIFVLERNNSLFGSTSERVFAESVQGMTFVLLQASIAYGRQLDRSRDEAILSGIVENRLQHVGDTVELFRFRVYDRD